MTAIRFPLNATAHAGLLLLCLTLGLSSGCRKQETGKKESGPTVAPQDGSPPKTTQAGTEEGARAVLSRFLEPNADHAALSKQLRPTREDYAAIFEPEFARKAEATYTPAWEGGQLVIAPKPRQTQLLLFPATTLELKKWAGNAARHFPGGYQKVAPKFKDGLTIYAFKFVEQGKSTGMAFDGLVYVNGNWRIFPKPWRVAN